MELARDHLRTRGGQGCSHEGLPKATSCITPPTTILSLPSCLSSLLLLETFPGQKMGRPSNRSPCEASNTSDATACCGRGLGSVPLEISRRHNHDFTAAYDMSPVAPSRSPLRHPRSCRLSLVLADAQLVDADESFFGEWCYAASSLGSHLASYSSVGDLRLAIQRVDL